MQPSPYVLLMRHVPDGIYVPLGFVLVAIVMTIIDYNYVSVSMIVIVLSAAAAFRLGLYAYPLRFNGNRHLMLPINLLNIFCLVQYMDMIKSVN